MFAPSGVSKRVRTSAPARANTAGAMRYVAPFAQSSTTRRPSSLGAMELRKSSYFFTRPRTSPMSPMRPSVGRGSFASSAIAASMRSSVASGSLRPA